MQYKYPCIQLSLSVAFFSVHLPLFINDFFKVLIVYYLMLVVSLINTPAYLIPYVLLCLVIFAIKYLV